MLALLCLLLLAFAGFVLIWDPIYMGGRGFPYVDPYLHGGKGTGAFFSFFSIALSCFLSLLALLGCLGAFLGCALGALVGHSWGVLGGI